ncbi:PaaI family thioesterase [Alkalihalobacterium alkalinitrilicum]|uniref:PaaI family thioesterase n=1 Tax=Alkalihalobacterium alkalinitrilicum TaxID=427920 RepID=UPI000A489351|nr:PaaI family thioesterase [Alkalihalobacterium alkalinitrilicum]
MAEKEMINIAKPKSPLGEILGFHVLEKKDGMAIVEYEANSRHTNPGGTLHGGVLCVIADEAMGAAFASTLREGESLTTIELKVNYLKPVWSGKLTAVGKVIKNGNTIALVESEVTDDKGSLVAKVVSTCMRLKGDMAKGR